MKSQRLLVTLTVVNIVLLVFSLDQSRAAVTQGDAPYSVVARLRSWISAVASAQVSRFCPQIRPSRCPDGTTGYPETVLLRLINSQGRPNIKIAATEQGAGLVLGGESNPTDVQILAEGPNTSLKLNNKDGQQQLIKP